MHRSRGQGSGNVGRDRPSATWGQNWGPDESFLSGKRDRSNILADFRPYFTTTRESMSPRRYSKGIFKNIPFMGHFLHEKLKLKDVKIYSDQASARTQ